MKKILKKVGAVLLALTFWQLAEMRIHSNILLVTPAAVIRRLTTIKRRKERMDIRIENLSKAYDEKKDLEHYSAIIREHQCRRRSASF